MFDLITTFSTDRSISYQNTIANLHILDYDYYFKITDALLTEKVGQAWLLFDEILKKGFDGHNFMVGLCEHFRNLLVCKDAATVQLLQVSGSVQQKYVQQAAQAPVSFLATAMHYASECDQGYKTSKNAKLLVELALMKMAHIPAAVNLARLVQENGDPLKKKDDSGVNVNGSNATTYPTNGASKPANGVHENGSNGYKATPAVKATPSLATPSISLNPTVPSVSTQAVAAPAATPQMIGESPYSTEQLSSQWEAFSRTRSAPTEGLIMSRGYQLDGHTLLLKLDNQIQMVSLNAMKMDLLEFLRRNLNNRNIQVKGEIGEVEIRKTIYTNLEKFKYLAQKHPVLTDLRTQLGLEVE
jgi:DNA polymerase-3 subunit gamma/tau